MTAEPLPANLPLTLYRGDTRVWQDVFADTETGDPIDLTGYTWLSEIRVDRDSDEVLAVITVDDTEAVDGKLRRTLPSSESVKLTVTTAFWDLQATRPDGTVRTYLAGRVRVRADVSRA